jgi:hypothetical protein
MTAATLVEGIDSPSKIGTVLRVASGNFLEQRAADRINSEPHALFVLLDCSEPPCHNVMVVMGGIEPPTLAL